MKKKNPLKGLLKYSFYSASGNLLIALFIFLVLGGFFVITGHESAHQTFLMSVILFPPPLLMMNASGKIPSRWDRFQLAMPVRRKNIVTSQYICVILGLIIVFPLYVAVFGVSVALHEGLFDSAVANASIQLPLYIGISLVAAGIFYPAVCTKLGEGKSEALLLAVIVVAVGFIMFISWLGSIVVTTVSVIFYCVSYVVTRLLYARKDF